MADVSVVHTDEENGGRTTHATTTSVHPSASEEEEGVPQAEPTGLAPVRQAYAALGLSETVVKFLCESWRDGTSK